MDGIRVSENTRACRLIEELRASHPDMVKVFTKGSCFQMFLILEAVFPGAECWYDEIYNHVYTKIGHFFFDIRGCHTRGSIGKSLVPMGSERYNRALGWHKAWKPGTMNANNSRDEENRAPASPLDGVPGIR